MQIDGACHCGQVTFQAEIDPATVSLCNCTDCQTFAGAPFRWTVLTHAGTFRLRSGTVKGYVKLAESGKPREQGFCPNCGNALWGTALGADPNKIYSLRVGAITQRDQLTPRSQKWMRSAQPWTGNLGALPATEK